MPTQKAKYLGETPSKYYRSMLASKITRPRWAMIYIERYGQIDGDHHKAWVLDQVMRILLGTPVIVTIAKWDNGTQEPRIKTGEPSKKYMAWAASMCGKWDKAEEHEYSYDEGIAP